MEPKKTIPGQCAVATQDGGVCGRAALKRITFVARGMQLRAPICADCKALFDQREGLGEGAPKSPQDILMDSLRKAGYRG